MTNKLQIFDGFFVIAIKIIRGDEKKKIEARLDCTRLHVAVNKGRCSFNYDFEEEIYADQNVSPQINVNTWIVFAIWIY